MLVVGLGSVGARHVRIARDLLPRTKIAALRRECSGNEPAFGINACFTRLEDALEFEPDAAVIAGPASMHIDVAVPLANAGVHLLIEKPISDDSAKVNVLLDSVRKQGCTLMIGYNLRYLRSLEYFRSLIQRGVIGPTLSVRSEVGQYLPTWRPDVDYRNTVSASAALGGGVLLELSHEIDYLRWIFGEIEWVSAVLARQGNFEIDVEDTAHLVIGFAQKAKERAVVGCLNMDFVRHDKTRMCTVIGESGSLRWNAVTGTVESFARGGDEWCAEFSHLGERDDSYRSEWREFLRCVRDRAWPCVTGEDGLAALRVVEAARRSSQIQRVVSVNDVLGRAD